MTLKQQLNDRNMTIVTEFFWWIVANPSFAENEEKNEFFYAMLEYVRTLKMAFKLFVQAVELNLSQRIRNIIRQESEVSNHECNTNTHVSSDFIIRDERIRYIRLSVNPIRVKF